MQPLHILSSMRELRHNTSTSCHPYFTFCSRATIIVIREFLKQEKNGIFNLFALAVDGGQESRGWVQRFFFSSAPEEKKDNLSFAAYPTLDTKHESCY